jgi:hypothetical protein
MQKRRPEPFLLLTRKTSKTLAFHTSGSLTGTSGNLMLVPASLVGTSGSLGLTSSSFSILLAVWCSFLPDARVLLPVSRVLLVVSRSLLPVCKSFLPIRIYPYQFHFSVQDNKPHPAFSNSQIPSFHHQFANLHPANPSVKQTIVRFNNLRGAYFLKHILQ